MQINTSKQVTKVVDCVPRAQAQICQIPKLLFFSPMGEHFSDSFSWWRFFRGPESMLVLRLPPSITLASPASRWSIHQRPHHWCRQDGQWDAFMEEHWDWPLPGVRWYFLLRSYSRSYRNVLQGPRSQWPQLVPFCSVNSVPVPISIFCHTQGHNKSRHSFIL